MADSTTVTYKDKRGEYRLRRTATNGEIIGASSESYKAKKDCDANASRNTAKDRWEFYKDKAASTAGAPFPMTMAAGGQGHRRLQFKEEWPNQCKAERLEGLGLLQICHPGVRRMTYIKKAKAASPVSA